MKETRLMMGMPITIEIVDAQMSASAAVEAFERVFAYFDYVDQTFSTYKETSEVSRMNRGELALRDASLDVQLIYRLAEETRLETKGYFDIHHNGTTDPSGIVKGWAIQRAANLVGSMGYKNYYIDAGGDVQVAGMNAEGLPWRTGIRNPFDTRQVVKTLELTDCGIATSGLYIRGKHIYNPKREDDPLDEIVSLTVIGPNVYEADRFVTPAFAMGQRGIHFIERRPGLEGYMIDRNGVATFTSGFAHYIASASV